MMHLYVYVRVAAVTLLYFCCVNACVEYAQVSELLSRSLYKHFLGAWPQDRVMQPYDGAEVLEVRTRTVFSIFDLDAPQIWVITGEGGRE